MTRPSADRLAEIRAFADAPATSPTVRDLLAEIDALRADVGRLTRERDALRETAAVCRCKPDPY